MTLSRRFVTSLSGCVNGLTVFGGIALTGLMLAQVIMRYMMESGFLGIEEVGVLLGVWFYFLGMALATRSGEQIRGGIADLLVTSPRGRWLLAVYEAGFTLIANTIFCWLALQYTLSLFESGRTSTYMSWPTWLWTASMACGFLLATLFSLRQCLRLIEERRA